MFGPDVAELLHAKARPTAIVCFNDACATTAIRTADQLGLRVPDDLSLVGFDDDVRATSCTPPLTTIHSPLDEIATQAIDMIMSLIRGDTLEPCRVNVPTRLVQRASTGPAPSKVRPPA